ncbi:GIY-YIG nuclease family protein [Paracoccus sp. (in: a-proteobacteria)]|uniref:GIY-YIG nuclease family protein n=1 Tax=Paracoccus sp. TaxID=267 RepID=UPI0026E10FC7|nr:GIY-YIG nuclease family protein [Paracoccus sp. (in: a-proteobacteria)]MDO5648588.1 GIY-YIG nuclease family protein [Paracoccus sp. (in: a-proteobacteria)]
MKGYTIQLYMPEGTPDGLLIASQFGWTGQITVARQTTFDSLLQRDDLDRPGVYILSGPDPDHPSRNRTYIGEADNIRDRIKPSANEQGDWWEIAAAITTSDNTLNKGHIRYLEARLIERAHMAGRVHLTNGQQPKPERRYLPEAERANMERFITTLASMLPVVGLDLLKPAPAAAQNAATAPVAEPRFVIAHKSGLNAQATERGGEFIVLAGSQVLRDPGYVQNSYAGLRQTLMDDGTITDGPDAFLTFATDTAFNSPSAAAAVILASNRNGRTEWRMTGTQQTYADWQSRTLPDPKDTL